MGARARVSRADPHDLSGRPWNAPFYKKLGFVTLALERLEPAQRALFEREDQMELRSEDRFFMRRDLR